MLTMLTTESTLGFDLFGDIIIENNDLKVNRGLASKIQILADFLKTNREEYIFFPSYGADYDRFIGKGMDDELVQTIVTKIERDIRNLSILPEDEYAVYGNRIGPNTIQVRVIMAEDDQTIFIDFDNINGVTVGQ